MPSVKREQLAAMNWHYKRFSLEYCLDSFERAGYTSVAFWAGPPHYEINDRGYEDVNRLKQKLHDHKLTCTCFTPCSGHQNYQYGIFGKEHIEAAYRYFTNGVHIAAELGASLMSASSGNGFINEPREDAWKRSVDLLRRVAREAEKYGVIITVESLRPPETRIGVTLNDVYQLLAEIDHPNCKAMIDTTAMGVNGENVWQWFEQFGSDIRNLHFIDGNPYGHLAWGDGTFHLADMLECLNHYHYEGPIGFEVTDKRYWYQPELADMQIMKIMSRFIEN